VPGAIFAPVLSVLALLVPAALALGCLGCKGAADQPDPATSPQAKAEPAPLANLTAGNGARARGTAMSDAGPPPEPLRGDTAVAPDSPRETVRETAGKGEAARDAKELAGYALQAVIRTGEGPPAPRGSEVNTAAIDAARRKTEARVAIEVSQTRARLVLGPGFVLPPTTELRARVDRYGFVALWPGEDTYRVVEPGALRALLGERRLDVAPLSPAEVALGDEGARRLGMRTRRAEVSTRVAKASVELGTFRDAGEGGRLLCRVLLDLMSADPSTAACEADEIPLHAELRWTTQGALTFDVTGIARRSDLSAQNLAAPPPSLGFEPSPPPLPPAEMALSRAELASFRTAPLEVVAAGARDAQAPPPESGLALINSSDELRVAWLDGVAVAWVAPSAREALPTLVRGRYVVQWRTFLGDGWQPPETITIPGTSEVGALDAGAR
jgi:hypothetical protein